MEPASIVVVGSLMVDHIFFLNRLPEIGETYPADDYKKAPGGKGANAAIATYRACHEKLDHTENASDSAHGRNSEIKVSIIGAVGEDAEGEYMLDALRTNHVDTHRVRKEKLNTGMMFVMVEELERGKSRDNRLISTNGANGVFVPDDFSTIEALGGGQTPDLIVSQLEINIEAIEKMLETAGQHKIDVLLNAAPANVIVDELYKHVTHLVVNETEAAILSGLDLADVNESTREKIAKDFLSRGVSNAVITLGADGACYANKEGSGYVKAVKVEPIDPTGAGDTFTGAYAAEYVRQKKRGEAWDIRRAVVRACAAGTLNVKTAGAQEGIPWDNEIDEFIAENDEGPRAEL